MDFPSRGRALLEKIHYWKTRNRAGTTDRYAAVLEAEGMNEKLLNLRRLLLNCCSPQKHLSSEFARELLDTLRVEEANLPVCTAQASFLTERNIPILDRFVAQFFSRTVSPEVLRFRISDSLSFDMCRVFKDAHPVDFILEDDGTDTCKPRLAVYEEKSYRHNLDLFAFKLMPELDRLADELRVKHVMYQDVIHGEQKEFTAVDVEMAVFSFGTANRSYFECWYESEPTTLSLN
jgi:hypothetical protein